MLTFEKVMDAPLEKLGTAAQDWGAMAKKLEELAESARNGMKAKAAQANWCGVEADVTREFVDKTVKEFDDAAKQAKGIYRALTEGHATFKRIRTQLRQTVEDAPAAGFLVDARGKVTAKPMDEAQAAYAAQNPEYQRTVQQHLGEWQRRIEELVDACDDADRSLSRMLRANVGDGRDFSAPKYTSMKSEQADHAAGLARKGRKLTHDELVELNDLLADNAKNPEFTTTFHEKLGPKGTLEFFGTMSTDTENWGKTDSQRLADVQELQRNLGLTLATATDPDHPRHLPDKFGQDLRRLGTERIPVFAGDTNAPFGYQLLGGIMRSGQYDKRFLVPVAEHAAQVHAKDPNLFASSANRLRNPFNPSGVNGSGYDPAVGFLEALGHSPEAAKEFFDPDRTPQAYDHDGTPKSGAADLGKAKDGTPITNYLDYFGNEQYEVVPDSRSGDPADLQRAKQYMPDALGHALEAATLGHAWDDPAPTLERDDTSAAIMKEVVSKYGGDPTLLSDQQALSDSVGRMGAGYIDDINNSLDGNDKGGPFAPKPGSTGHATFDGQETARLLSALGQYPDAYATLSAAEMAYTTSVLESQVRPDGSIDHAGAMEAARVGAEVHGILDQSRADQELAGQQAKQEEYQKAVEQRYNMIGTGTSAVIGAGASLIPGGGVVVPLAVEVGSGTLEALSGHILGDLAEAELKALQDEGEKTAEELRREIYRRGENMMTQPTRYFIDHHGLRSGADDDRVLEQLLVVARDGGYLTGSTRENRVGYGPQTPTPSPTPAGDGS
ncbi:hypothetical protein [Streptomyces sp. NPDC006551]|uniref:hypothetical protein n=1 Tax=Streptomyces sp. NPDC006551 TaxID=3157178 RepID=UPI0033B797AA